MFCKKRTFEEKPRCDHSVTGAVLRMSAFYEPSPIDVFQFQEHEVPNDTIKSIRVTSDIYMLFNQQRLDRMTRESLIQHFETMSVRDSGLAALRSKLTDDQLISIVKSRYIQQPSELLAWSNYLNSLGDQALQSYVAAQQQQQQSNSLSVTVVPPSNPQPSE